MHRQPPAPHPPQPPRQRGGAQGFTLIEMMTAMVVLAVLLAVAAPGLAAFVRSSRVNAAQSELVSSFMLARSEAAKRGQDVQIVAASGSNASDFSNGWLVSFDRNGDGLIDRTAGSPEIIRSYPAPASGIAVRTLAAGSAVRFSATGFLSPAAQVVFYVCDLDPAGRSKSYQVSLEAVGLTDILTVACPQGIQ